MDPEFAALSFHRQAETYYFLFGSLNEIVAYGLTTGGLNVDLAKKLTFVKPQETDDGPVFPILASAVFIQ